MVKHVTSLGRNGVHDFLLIRASAIILILYTVYLLSFCLFANVTYLAWTEFFGAIFTKLFTMLALVCILIHAWIGLWQVLTDYVKCAKLRALLQLIVVAVLIGYVFSGLFVLWGV